MDAHVVVLAIVFTIVFTIVFAVVFVDNHGIIFNTALVTTLVIDLGVELDGTLIATALSRLVNLFGVVVQILVEYLQALAEYLNVLVKSDHVAVHILMSWWMTFCSLLMQFKRSWMPLIEFSQVIESVMYSPSHARILLILADSLNLS